MERRHKQRFIFYDLEYKQKRKPIRSAVIRMIVAAVLVFFCIGMRLWAGAYPAQVTAMFLPYSQKFAAGWGLVPSMVPFSVAEWLGYGILIYGIIALVRACARCKTQQTKVPLLRYVSYVVLWTAIAVTFFTATWGLNYFGEPLAKELNLPIRAYTKEQLIAATSYYFDQYNLYAKKVNRDADGLLEVDGFSKVGRDTLGAYDRLGEQYPIFCEVNSRPKRVVISPIMSWMAVDGMYVPFTAECNVNPSVPSVALPFTMAHEVAHKQGIAREDEAGFVAFLACSQADQIELRYSAYYEAFLYCYTQLARLDEEQAWFFADHLTEPARLDFVNARQYYEDRKGLFHGSTSKMYDWYLKGMDQTSGVGSYDEVVDLLVAEYLKTNK